MKVNWDKRFMDLAKYISEWSKDRSTKVGAVIVNDDNIILSVGYNGFCRGCDDTKEERHERPAKYKYTEHAERNAIYNANRLMVCLKGAKIYIPWFPCTDCARAIIQSGIRTVVVPAPNFQDERWGEDFKVSVELFEETGVNVIHYEE
jgi:dCMP deaminase